MSTEEFEQYAQEAYRAIPETIRGRIHNLAFVIKDRPGNDMEPDLLGCYIGVPTTEWESGYDSLPDMIMLFRENIKAEALEQDGDTARVIRETVWHEVGHALGIDEKRMEVYEQRWEAAWKKNKTLAI
ncbi:MAG: metallopeptidase family protein [Patescibacteria group bacterium]